MQATTMTDIKTMEDNVKKTSVTTPVEQVLDP